MAFASSSFSQQRHELVVQGLAKSTSANLNAIKSRFACPASDLVPRVWCFVSVGPGSPKRQPRFPDAIWRAAGIGYADDHHSIFVNYGTMGLNSRCTLLVSKVFNDARRKRDVKFSVLRIGGKQIANLKSRSKTQPVKPGSGLIECPLARIQKSDRRTGLCKKDR